jgi:DNA-directed RNA polymerase specialized sigma24 family protein
VDGGAPTRPVEADPSGPPDRVERIPGSAHGQLTKALLPYDPTTKVPASLTVRSVSEADNAVQDAWLRLSRADTSSVENLGGWLTTVVARVCLNMLRVHVFKVLGAYGPPP